VSPGRSTTFLDGSNATATISCEGVGRTFTTASGSVAALAGVDARFDPATLHVIVGPTGSGKSTLLRILAATDQPTEGRVLIDGQDVSRIGSRARRRLRRRTIGYVLQRPGANLLPYLTVIEHLELSARLRHGGRATDADELLGRVGLTHRGDHRPSQLSGGEQQRLAFAAAVTGRPRVVIADEPTAELDHESAAALLEAVAGLRDLGTCLILSSHDPAVLPHADRVIPLDHGHREPASKPGEPNTMPAGWTRPASLGQQMARSAGRAHRRAAGPEGGPLVGLADVSKSYRRGGEDVRALRGVSLTVGPGEIVGLVGPSGSGKTTLLNLICGWEDPDDGTVTGSVAPVGEGLRGWDDVAIVAQGLGLSPELTVRENVALALRLSGARSPDDLEQLLADLGLSDLADRYPAETSLGEQQRTAVARALALDPSLLLADEPTAHQDADHADTVLDALRDRADDGGACLVATHDARLLPRLDRVLRLHDGQLIE
jgi:ABC-type lipoprotein export system ATPase subunit